MKFTLPVGSTSNGKSSVSLSHMPRKILLVFSNVKMFTRIFIFLVAIHFSVNQSPPSAEIVEYVNEPLPGGGYHFRFETTDGLAREETGRIEEGRNSSILRVIGYYSYRDSNGTAHKVYYQADEQGSKYETDQNPVTDVPISTTTEEEETTVEIGAPVIATISGGGLGRK